ncbi:hypothetical protein G7046_g2500 [Stylonectria norvegica]|nr:hypothetical protein G7046_g2500 [Stylonectria norvegica]
MNQSPDSSPWSTEAPAKVARHVGGGGSSAIRRHLAAETVRRHRDETSKTVTRNSRKTASLSPSTLHAVDTDFSLVSIVSSSSKSTASSIGDHVVPFKLPTFAASASTSTLTDNPLILSTLLPDTETVALSFFFASYGSGRDKEATCQFYELLPSMYARSHPSSPLALATVALAVNITSLWSLRGIETVTARRHYIKAVAGAREAVLDSARSRSDDMLMTALVLEAYEGITAYYQGNRNPGVHASGLVALMRHRGELNFQDYNARRLLVAVRSKLVQDTMAGSLITGELDDIWRDTGPMPDNPAIGADKLAHSLLRLASNDTDGLLLLRAAALENECTRWLDALPAHWRSVAVHRDSVHKSVRDAGFYGATCDVYTNFSIANIRNWHRIIELNVLQIQRRCYAAKLHVDEEHGTATHLSLQILSRMQTIMDEICASAPYLVGDLTRPSSPVLGDTVHFAHAEVATMSGLKTFPESMAQHERQMASSGSMALHRTLTAALYALGKEGNGLRGGQRDWIVAQVTKCRSILHFRREK